MFIEIYTFLHISHVLFMNRIHQNITQKHSGKIFTYRNFFFMKIFSPKKNKETVQSFF